MGKFYDLLFEKYGHENNIAEVVGRGLDRLGRDVTSWEIDNAEQFYMKHKDSIDRNYSIGGRRNMIEKYVERGCREEKMRSVI
jgi:hypothetical protein